MPTAVLLSAGLDSVVLAAWEARRGPVHPVYVSAGLAWEAEEIAAVRRLLAVPPLSGLQPLVHLTFTVTDLYPETHWALRGDPPAFDTPDQDVYLPGRNVALLAKSALHCAQHGIGRIALGLLADNPFPDATPEFLDAMARALTLGLGHALTIDAPFANLRKPDVIRLGMDLHVPIGRTISCMRPVTGLHCGRCSKCRERSRAFRAAGVADSTAYAVAPGGGTDR
jgi:7-cyano-7-deazaguanine synthase